MGGKSASSPITAAHRPLAKLRLLLPCSNCFAPRGNALYSQSAGAEDMSKKNNAAKSEKMVVDKTFGMKNKNKSKKVQKFIAQVNHSASNRLVDKKQEKKKDEAKSRKQAKKDHEAEIALLFDVVPEKKKKKSAMDDAPAEAEEEEEDLDNVEAFLAKMGIEAPKAIGRRQIARQRRDA